MSWMKCVAISISMPADGLAPLGARICVGTWMMKFGFFIYEICSWRIDSICSDLGKIILTHRSWDKIAAILQTIFSNAFSWMKMLDFFIKISPIFVPKGPVDYIPALVKIMAWCQPGDKSLSEPMMVSIPTHIFIIWPQWVNNLSSDFYH